MGCSFLPSPQDILATGCWGFGARHSRPERPPFSPARFPASTEFQRRARPCLRRCARVSSFRRPHYPHLTWGKLRLESWSDFSKGVEDFGFELGLWFPKPRLLTTIHTGRSLQLSVPSRSLSPFILRPPLAHLIVLGPFPIPFPKTTPPLCSHSPSNIRRLRRRLS